MPTRNQIQQIAKLSTGSVDAVQHKIDEYTYLFIFEDALKEDMYYVWQKSAIFKKNAQWYDSRGIG
ncbi:hypothetical protein [Clostridium sp. UBA4548]|uniref:hypothetical protein n=1 Tax=Clostridium sp. UBA4548 TaxID=1946361 RepID=UPI0025BA5B11|nr:hypothetical protein [Clostridium sp. UBA4548]